MTAHDAMRPERTFECMLCGATEGTLRYADCEDYYLGKAYRADYLRCDRCALVQQSPIPAHVGDFYDAYPIHQRKSGLHRLFRSAVMGASYFDLRKFVRRWTGAERPVVIDFGCGDGWFLGENADLPITRVGYELDPKVAAHLSGELGIPVYSNEQALIAEWGGRADLVTMHFVMEHVTDLNGTFATIARLLKPGGTLHFSVPNIDSWEARLFGKKWHNLDSPRHVSFPSDGPTRLLASRWGFEFVSRTELPFPNGIAGSVPTVLTGKFRFGLFLASLPFAIVLSRFFPSGDVAYRLTRTERGSSAAPLST